LPDWSDWAADCQERKRTMLRKTHYDNVPIKPQRVYEEMKQGLPARTCATTAHHLARGSATPTPSAGGMVQPADRWRMIQWRGLLTRRNCGGDLRQGWWLT